MIRDTKLMISTPAQNGLVDIEYAHSLARTLHELSNCVIPVSVNIKRSGSLLIAERNKILWDFYKSDCSHLLCIDSDIGWSPADVFNLLASGKHIIGACYLHKGDLGFMFRPLNYEYIHIDQDKLIQVKAMPMGFVMISRIAIEMMVKGYPELYYRSKDGKDEGYGFCNTMIKDGQFWGEDYSFFLRAVEANLQPYVDPTIELWHSGLKGKLLNSLLDGQNDSSKS